MRFAFADPPYYGYAGFYAKLHPEAAKWDTLEAHADLCRKLLSDYDGFVLCLTSGNLADILPLFPPKTVRVGAWVKPFCSFKPNVNPAYAWEPVIFRSVKPEGDTVRDWVSANITLQRGLTGAKPRDFCRWCFDLMGAKRGDTLDDLFPGSGAVSAAWAEWNGDKSPMPLLPLEVVA